MLTLYVLAGFATVLSLLAFVISREATRIVTVAGLVLAGLFCVVGWGQTVEAFGGLYRFDTLARGLTLVAILGGLWALLLGPAKKFEYPLLLLFAVTGMHIMASSPNLVVLLIALEVFSLPLYVLATWQRDEKGFEAGLKYFLLGALGAAIFLYGIALYFGATGSFTAGSSGSGPLYIAGLFLIMAAFAFKTAMVPFQWWSPDVYQGSPTVVTLFMATAVKAAAFAAMLRIFTPEGLEAWGVGMAVLIALSTLFGNLGALNQTEAKRLFAYSSIANAGYLGLGLLGPTGQATVPFYLLTYGLATGLIFAVLSMLSNQDVPLERLRGLWYRKPLLGGAMGLGILSVLGLPPLAGFWAKYLVFQEAARAGFYGLVVLALVTSAIGAYYYLKTFFLIFSKPTPVQEAEDREAEAALAQFGSSEAPGIPVAAAPMGLTQGLMAPAARMGAPALGLLLAAMGLLGLLSVLPGLGLRAFSAGLTPAVAALSITAPKSGSTLTAGSQALQGTGRPGESLELFDNGNLLGTVTVGPDGKWSFPLPASAQAPGAHTFEARQPGQTRGERVEVEFLRPSGPSFTGLQDGATVAATGFTLQGTAQPGQVLEVFEDGASLGRVTADANGQWSLNVPPPSGGTRVYEVRPEGAASGARISLVVPEAQAGAICSQSFALSNLQAGGTVSRPFRFGGVGSASSYTVLVRRGDRIIGRKEIPLSAACGWSYFSDPGPGEVTYEVRETGKLETEPPLATITLKVQ
ncbi:MAG: proton-conducting transporter membrane subunit [Meiothermus sp.]|uniref:proton-conducting transporter transmembrane domain-containing protein n=1 Tax=Meiothermus sp. TaxID=1955249 RepID=UPI0025F024CA|nr:proton-conducting transporter membrane subunit [Meiothermus sp.]MCS7067566.1 NADH-quinone oxidoreductase subunit N [Meiothermus sp.]MDW8425635.1 proton-conducting transporter membrane subunit [Meiothermus sp.]